MLKSQQMNLGQDMKLNYFIVNNYFTNLMDVEFVIKTNIIYNIYKKGYCVIFQYH
jgi:hypothetical protein